MKKTLINTIEWSVIVCALLVVAIFALMMYNFEAVSYYMNADTLHQTVYDIATVSRFTTVERMAWDAECTCYTTLQNVTDMIWG